MRVPRMVFSKSLDKIKVMEREYREGANVAIFSGFIRDIRLFAPFALKKSRL